MCGAPFAVWRFGDVPVLQGVGYQPPVEGVVVSPVSCPEVPIAAIVGVLVGGHVVPDEKFLQREEGYLYCSFDIRRAQNPQAIEFACTQFCAITLLL